MSEYRSIYTLVRDGTIESVLRLGVLTTIITTLGTGHVLFGQIVLDAGAGVAVPLGVLFGPVGAAAAGLGSVGRAVIVGVLTPTAFARAGAHVFVALVASAVWRAAPPMGRIWSILGPPWFPRYLLATIVGTASGAAVLGWAAELLGRSPFFLAPGWALSFGVAGVMLGVPMVVVAERFQVCRIETDANASDDVPTRVVGVLLLVPLGWLLIGTVGSVGYRSFDVLFSYNPQALQILGVKPLAVFYDDSLFGHGAVRAQAVLGGVMAALLVAGVWATLNPDSDLATNGGKKKCD